ncbi:MAG: cold shock domain-containing protein [Nitrosomonas sp.]
MRIEGSLSKWNDDRGFGFITPSQGGQEIFVHISVFPKDGLWPSLGENSPLKLKPTTTETNQGGQVYNKE